MSALLTAEPAPVFPAAPWRQPPWRQPPWRQPPWRQPPWPTPVAPTPVAPTHVAPTPMAPTAGIYNYWRIGDPTWGEECPIRITDDGGKDSTRVSTHCPFPQPQVAEGAVYNLPVPALDKPMLAIFEVVKFAYMLEYMHHFRGFGEVFSRYLRYNCMQTHHLGQYLPMLALHVKEPSLEVNRFVQGAWYFHKLPFTCQYEVMQVCIILQTSQLGIVVHCRKVLQCFTNEVSALKVAFRKGDKDAMGNILGAALSNNKPLHKFAVSSQCRGTMLNECTCCYPPCQEAIRIGVAASGTVFCPRKRIFGRGRVFEP